MKSNNQLFQKKIKLSDQKIHVFLLQLDLFDCDDFISCLSEDELQRANRLKIEEKKKQFVVTRGALRKILSNLLNVSADKIPFCYGEHNKPYIEYQYDKQSIEFNISHSGNYALIAIGLGCKIGVDIEMMNHEIDYQSLSRRFFSDKENEMLFQLNEEQQLDAFYRIWVRKESFIKANGKGIAFGLDRFSVSLDDNSKAAVDITDSKSTNEQWYCYNFMDIDNYKTALASCGKEKQIIFYQ